MITSIVTETRIEEIVLQMPKIEVKRDSKPFEIKYGWGDKYELTKFLVNKSNRQAYPLIWCLPTTDRHLMRGEICEKNTSLVIATQETNKSKTSAERWQRSFDKVLNPISDLMLNGFESATSTEIKEEKWDIDKYTDFHDEIEGAQNIKLWDCINLRVEVIFNKNQINKIKWQKIKP